MRRLYGTILFYIVNDVLEYGSFCPWNTCTILVTGRLIWHIWRKPRYTFCLLLNRFFLSGDKTAYNLCKCYIFVYHNYMICLNSRKSLLAAQCSVFHQSWQFSEKVDDSDHWFIIVDYWKKLSCLFLPACPQIQLFSPPFLVNERCTHHHQMATLKWLCIFTDTI